MPATLNGSKLILRMYPKPGEERSDTSKDRQSRVASIGPLRIVLAFRAAERVHRNSFRGRKCYHEDGDYFDCNGRYDWQPMPAAGNFSLWPNYGEMERSCFIDDFVRPWVMKEVTDRHQFALAVGALQPQRGQISTCIDAGADVGWASSAHISELDGWTFDTLEQRTLNTRNVKAQVITRTEFLAPRTPLVSIDAFIKPDDSGWGWHCVINNLYPGESLGSFEYIVDDPAHNNVSKRSGYALFNWNHPGETSS